MKLKSVFISIMLILLSQAFVFGVEDGIVGLQENQTVISENELVGVENEIETEVEENVGVESSSILSYRMVIEEIIKTLNERDSYFYELVNPENCVQYVKDLGVELPENLDKEVSRVEFAKLLNILCEKVGLQKNYSTDLINVSDIFVDLEGLSEEEVSAIETVFIEGLMGGKEIDYFVPNDILTETELNKVLDRLLNGYSRKNLFNHVDSCFMEEERLAVLEKYGYEEDRFFTRNELVNIFIVLNEELYVDGVLGVGECRKLLNCNVTYSDIESIVTKYYKDKKRAKILSRYMFRVYKFIIGGDLNVG